MFFAFVFFTETFQDGALIIGEWVLCRSLLNFNFNILCALSEEVAGVGSAESSRTVYSFTRRHSVTTSLTGRWGRWIWHCRMRAGRNQEFASPGWSHHTFEATYGFCIMRYNPRTIICCKKTSRVGQPSPLRRYLQSHNDWIEKWTLLSSGLFSDQCIFVFVVFVVCAVFDKSVILLMPVSLWKIVQENKDK